jgi:hypothetical protein
MSCFTDIHTITRIGTDTAQLKEFQDTEFQSHSGLFFPKSNKIERETFLKRAECFLAEIKAQ